MIRVPGDAPSPQAAIRLAHPGDVIVLSPGTYRGEVTVPPNRSGIVIRGTDRNKVVFDGEDVRPFAIRVGADRVILENLTAHDYTGDAIQWGHVSGFRGRYLTVWNVGGYGFYAVASAEGVLDHDLASGAGNSGFYVGECDPCHTVVTHVIARRSAIGFSGTNASGDLTVTDSLWDRNGTGILPNSYNEEAHPPQQGAAFTGNVVRGSGTRPTPATDPLGGFAGLGIGVAGGQRDVVRGNVVTGSGRYGIVLFPTLQRGGSFWRPSANTIRGNTVEGSGRVDLAVATGSGGGNCFSANRFSSSLPRAIEQRLQCGVRGQTAGNPAVGRELAVAAPVAYARSGHRPSYRTMPPPGPQPNMPG